jgi:hypothetical protein
MTDDLVKRLRSPNGPFNWEDAVATYLEAADRIEKLEALIEKLRDDNSLLIDSFDKDFLRQDSRIEKLEAALKELLSLGSWGTNDLARTIILEALETNDA